MCACPKISIIMPAYNVAEYILDAFAAIRRQSFKDVEILCVDDGSTDNTRELVAEAQKSDARIRLFTQQNLGAAAARNCALDHAQGEYVVFLDPDDWYPEDTTLQKLYDGAVNNDVQVCGGGWERHRPDGTVTTKYDGLCFGYNMPDEPKMMSYVDCQFDYGYQRFIYSRQLLEREHLRFPPYRRFQDPPFFVRVMSAAGRYFCLNCATYSYRSAYKKIDWVTDGYVRAIHLIRGVREILDFSRQKHLARLHALEYDRINIDFCKIFRDCALASADVLRELVDLDAAVSQELLDEAELHSPGVVLSGRQRHIKPLLALEKDYLGQLPGPMGLWSDVDKKISVLLSVYNGEKYLLEALSSVLSQLQFTDIEFICVDDGSVDSSSDILKSVAMADSRVRVITQANQGLGAARTRMIGEARGEYLMFLDADDQLSSGDALRRAYEQVSRDNLDVLISAGMTMTESGKKLSKRYLSSDLIPSKSVFSPDDMGRSLYLLSYPGVCGKLFRRQFVVESGLFFPTVRRSEDFPFLEAILASATRLGVLDEPLFNRRIGTGASMEDLKDDMPLAFFDSEDILRRELEKRGLWNKFEPAVMVASIVRLWYNFSTMHTYEGCKAVYEEMKRRYGKNAFAGDYNDIRQDGFLDALKNILLLVSVDDCGEYFYRKNQATNKSLHWQRNKNKQLAAEVTRLSAERDTCKKRCSTAERAAMVAERRLGELRHSEAYRVGMVVTWPARKACGGIKCLRDNGIVYTLKHVVGKVLRKFGSTTTW